MLTVVDHNQSQFRRMYRHIDICKEKGLSSFIMYDLPFLYIQRRRDMVGGIYDNDNENIILPLEVILANVHWMLAYVMLCMHHSNSVWKRLPLLSN